MTLPEYLEMGIDGVVTLAEDVIVAPSLGQGWSCSGTGSTQIWQRARAGPVPFSPNFLLSAQAGRL
jgi:hypothetical protein